MSGVFTYTKTRKMHWTFIILWLMSQRGWSSFFAKTFNSWKPLIISAKRSILDVWEKLLNKPLCCEERSSRQDVFCKKSVLRNFAKFTGKHLCQSLFFNKVTGLRPSTLLKKRLWHRCFPDNFYRNFWKHLLLYNTSGRLLLGNAPNAGGKSNNHRIRVRVF